MKKAYNYGIIAILGLGLGFAVSYFLFPSKNSEPVLPPEREDDTDETEPQPVQPPNNKKGIISWKPQIPVGTDPNLNINDTLA
jgi:hypothetical protein